MKQLRAFCNPTSVLNHVEWSRWLARTGVFILKLSKIILCVKATAGEVSIILMWILPLKVQINFNLRNFLSLFTSLKYFFLIRRERFWDEDVWFAWDSRSRSGEVSCFLVCKRLSIWTQGTPHTSSGKFNNYFWWSSSAV